MEIKDAEQLLMMYSSKLSPEYLPTIKSRLMELDRTNALVAFSDLKDPTTALIITICEAFIGLHGISRFYIGDVGVGVAKLLTCGGCGIWWLVDLFLIQDGTRRKNTEKVLQLLT